MERTRLRLRTLLLAVLLLPALAAAQTDLQYDMEFRDARVDDILRVLAERYDANVAVSGRIDATTTVNLRGLGLEAALDALLEGSGFTWRREGREGNVIRVLSRTTPVTEVYPLSYTNASELVQVISAQVAGVTVNAEAHSNSLIVSGPLASVREVAWLVDNVDRYRAQVSIRAEMVEVTLGQEDVRGVDLTTLFSGGEFDADLNTSFSDGNENVNLNVATVQGDFDIRGLLAALREDREAHLLSSPEITTLDNQPAKVHVGERVPYQRATVETQTGATLAEVEFIDVGVKLDVTPTVSADDMLYLQIHSEVSEVLDQSVQNVPRIGTREADTRVLVRHGDTVVIGGLMKDNVNTVTKKVPILGDIPLLGMLFRRDAVQKTKTEFLVFIRPLILDDPSEMRADRRAQRLRDEVSGDR
jgi:type II secretory pathway component GspD/PulD (secretin)